MIIQNNKISLSLQNVPAPKDAGVAGSDAKDGSVSAVKADLSKDCAPGRSKESATYTEAQARQLNTEDKDVWEATEMSPSDFINRCMTGEDAKDVADEETPLEQYTSSQVERTLRRVKSQREDQREAVDRQVAKQEEIQAQTEEDAMVHQIESQLASSGLPVVSDNVSLVMDAYGLALESQNISRSGMNFLIGGNYPLTPEQMQKSQYTGSQGPEIPVEGYEQVQEQVDSILQEAGLDVSEDNKKQARWLYEQGLPVTAENIVKMNRIQELTQLDSGTLLARITDQMADGVLPGQADLMVPSRKEAAEMAEGLLTTTDEELSKVYVTEADFKTKLASSRDRDIRQKTTGYGPHRDDMNFLLGDMDVRKYGSQGQQRTCALSLKLSEIELVKSITGDTPVLLLDDVFSELDANRQNYLLDSISDVQTIVTCTGLDEFINNRFHLDKVFYVTNGHVIEKN